MKVSGTFRGWNHFVAFVLIRSVLQTCVKRKINLWQTINQIQNPGFSFY
jgi:hypothetical protein